MTANVTDIPSMNPEIAQIGQYAALFIVGVVIVAGIGVVVWLVASERAARRRPNGGLHPARPFKPVDELRARISRWSLPPTSATRTNPGGSPGITPAAKRPR